MTVNDRSSTGSHLRLGVTTAVRSFRRRYSAHPETARQFTRTHSGAGPLPGIQHPEGGWDLRPHRARVLTITEDVLADWARLFDEPGTPAAEARLLRPVTTADLEALSVLADQPIRLADHDYHWTAGWNETGAKTDGTIRWETAVPEIWDEVILQGPHFTVATPFAKQPNENCKTQPGLQRLGPRVPPRNGHPPHQLPTRLRPRRRTRARLDPLERPAQHRLLAGQFTGR